MGKAKAPHIQYAALPYRRVGHAAIEVMLITSRDTGRWVIPKGWQHEDLEAPGTAEREASEEGGLVGRVDERPIGHYRYRKRLAAGSSVTCFVEVFALEVERQRKSWPERKERHTRWFTVREAAAAVKEPELAAMIRNLPRLLAATRRRVRAA